MIPAISVLIGGVFIALVYFLIEAWDGRKKHRRNHPDKTVQPH